MKHEKEAAESRDKNKTPIVILGAGGTGIQVAESILLSEDKLFVGFLDDSVEKQEQGFHSLPVLGGLKAWKDLPDDYLFISSLYGPKNNLFFYELIQSLSIPETRWAVVIDPRAMVSKSAAFGYGVYVGAGTVVCAYVRLGNLCFVISNANVSHDCQLGEYVYCANSVSISGGVSIGAASYIGANCSIKEYTKIGSKAVVGIGSVVIRDVADGSIVVGNPARPIQRREPNSQHRNGIQRVVK